MTVKSVTEEYLPVDQKLLSRLSGILAFLGIIVMSMGVVALSNAYLSHDPVQFASKSVAWLTAICGTGVFFLGAWINMHVGWHWHK